MFSAIVLRASLCSFVLLKIKKGIKNHTTVARIAMYNDYFPKTHFKPHFGEEKVTLFRHISISEIKFAYCIIKILKCKLNDVLIQLNIISTHQKSC